MEFRDFIRQKLKLDSDSYYWDEPESALDHYEIKGQYEFCKSIWDARQKEIDEFKGKIRELENNRYSGES